MKLTEREQKICDKYTAYNKLGRVRCDKCPLLLSEDNLTCYATIDGRTKEAKGLRRF